MTKNVIVVNHSSKVPEGQHVMITHSPLVLPNGDIVVSSAMYQVLNQFDLSMMFNEGSAITGVGDITSLNSTRSEYVHGFVTAISPCYNYGGLA